MTTIDIMREIYKIDSEPKPDRLPYILNNNFEPTKEEEALLEDSYFLFITQESLENFPKRLNSTFRELASVWRRAGNQILAQSFMNLIKKEN